MSKCKMVLERENPEDAAAKDARSSEVRRSQTSEAGCEKPEAADLEPMRTAKAAKSAKRISQPGGQLPEACGRS